MVVRERSGQANLAKQGNNQGVSKGLELSRSIPI
jgi:hypothetical protein